MGLEIEVGVESIVSAPPNDDSIPHDGFFRLRYKMETEELLFTQEAINNFLQSHPVEGVKEIAPFYASGVIIVEVDLDSDGKRRDYNELKAIARGAMRALQTWAQELTAEEVVELTRSPSAGSGQIVYSEVPRT